MLSVLSMSANLMLLNMPSMLIMFTMARSLLSIMLILRMRLIRVLGMFSFLIVLMIMPSMLSIFTAGFTLMMALSMLSLLVNENYPCYDAYYAYYVAEYA